MNPFRQMLVGSLFALFSLLAFAHPNHGDEAPMTKEDAIVGGARVVSLLVDRKQLAESWQKKQLKEVSSRQTPAGLVWVISYENPNENDKAKRTLYIFFDEFGTFIGGNHSGNL